MSIHELSRPGSGELDPFEVAKRKNLIAEQEGERAAYSKNKAYQEFDAQHRPTLIKNLNIANISTDNMRVQDLMNFVIMGLCDIKDPLRSAKLLPRGYEKPAANTSIDQRDKAIVFALLGITGKYNTIIIETASRFRRTVHQYVFDFNGHKYTLWDTQEDSFAPGEIHIRNKIN